MAEKWNGQGSETDRISVAWPVVPLFVGAVILGYPDWVQAIEFKNPDGYVAMDLEVEGTDKAVADGTLKLKLETRRQQNIKARADIELNYNDREAVIEKLQVDYRVDKKNQWIAGISKKVMGLEYEFGKRSRLTVHRSPIYQKMEEQGIVGHQYSFAWDRKLKKKVHLISTVGADNGRNYNGMLSVQKRKKSRGAGAWYLLEAHRINNDHIPVFVQSYAFWYRPQQGGIALELFHGIDAGRTEYEKMFGNRRAVHFTGAKFEISTNHRLGNQITLTPLFQSSFWMDDVAHPGGNTLQFLAGMNVTRGRLRVAANVETYGAKLPGHLNERKFNRTNGYVEFAFFF